MALEIRIIVKILGILLGNLLRATKTYYEGEVEYTPR